ncbi:prenylcysteine oxidase 1 isoform X1 [Lepeophtheirus salmonis]|uniref:prenylcysteine oxidase 1 isoform X1 n=1 Tax=Lepeophtheirus salmonis TaxID=72036 RepID=UPI003AF3DA39
MGGRLATVKIAGREYEVGGSVIHGKNLLMKEFLQITDLKRNTHIDERLIVDYYICRIAIIGKNDEVLFNEYPYISTLQMLFRYGPTSLIKLQYLISTMLKEFSKVYPFLDQGHTFDSAKDFLLTISPRPRRKKVLKEEDSFVNLTKISIKEMMTNMNFSPELINELVSAVMRCNYGQSVNDANAFVGMVSLAGADDSLWSVQGGNKLIPERLLAESDINIINEMVTYVHKKGTSYLIGTKDNPLLKDENGDVLSMGVLPYDAVVIAAPLTSDANMGLKLPNSTKIPGKYHLTVTTIVHGIRDPKYFPGVSGNFLLYSDDENVINSVNLLKPVDYDGSEEVPSVWKIFSQRILSEDELHEIFSVIHSKEVIPWLAYPSYKHSFIDQSFVFPNYERLYYLNTIEWAASAMEMSAIGGKNVANMIYNQFKDSI